QEQQRDTATQPGDADSHTLQPRRTAVLSILGVGLGSLVLEACAQESGNGQHLAPIAEAVGSSNAIFAWGGTVIGVVPTSSTTPRPGDLANNTPNQLQTALRLHAPPLLVLARGCYQVGDGGGGVFYWDMGTGLENEDDGGTYIVPGGNVGSQGQG